MFESNLKVLSEKDLGRIHSGSLKILSDTGIRIENKRIRDMLEGIGCNIDGEVVKIPGQVVENVVTELRAISKTENAGEVERDNIKEDPSLYSSGIIKKRNHDEVRFYASGQSIYAHDLETGEIRLSTKKDLIDATRLVNAIPHIGLSHPTFIPQDVPAMTRDIHALEVLAIYYKEPKCLEVFSIQSIDYLIEIGVVLRGSKEELRKEPCFIYTCFSNSPLIFAGERLDVALRLHDLGFESAIGGTMLLPGASAPVTLAGSLVLQNAENLASEIINKLLNKKLRGYCVIPVIMDMKEMSSCAAAPESLLLSLGSIQLMQYYGIPVSALGVFSTDSKIPDVQTGFEKAYTMSLALAAGARSFSSLGLLGCSQVASLIQIVIDAEFASVINRVVRGIEVNEETLGVDLIKRIGIGGNFLCEEHTAGNFRKEMHLSEIFDRRSTEQWLTDKKSMVDKARDKVKALLKKAGTEPLLTAGQVKEIRKIVATADKNLG